MKNDHEKFADPMNSLDAGHVDPIQRRRTTVLASAAGVLLAATGVVAALTMSAGAQLPFSPEAAATTVTATPGFGSSNRDPGFDLRRPQFTAAAPQTPGEVECVPNLSRTACPPQRDTARLSDQAWFSEAQGPYTAIQSALQTATAEMQAQNIDGVRSACQQLRSSSQRLRGTLPSPNKALTAEIQGAVSELTTAADLCLAPDATDNLQAIMSHVEQANAHFGAAQQFIGS